MVVNEKGKLAITGVIIGVAAVVLTVLGNPGNMGFCIACFLRDTAGAMHLHTAPIVEYVRPEIIGIILGSFALSVLRIFSAFEIHHRIYRDAWGSRVSRMPSENGYKAGRR